MELEQPPTREPLTFQFRFAWRQHYELGRFFLKWLLLTLPLALVVGSACALFLWLLDWATAMRTARPGLLYLLPLAGVAIVLLYQRIGKTSDQGNNLVIDEIHEPGGGVPLRMTPLVLISTVVTHLFGGSAGREGTAVQMGGSIASRVGRILKLRDEDLSYLTMAGMAAGFGAVFGTPIAGAIFAMEVLVRGRIRYEAVIPCLMASIAADWICTGWGIQHTHYMVKTAALSGIWGGSGKYSEMLLLKVGMAGIAFGLAGYLFARIVHWMSFAFTRIPQPWIRPVIGGGIIIALVHLLQTRDYLGLGVSSPDPRAVTILSAFHPGGATELSWFWKILFTAITLSSGFKGGEVTPLFYIGATLGNVLAVALGAPIDLLAAIGFISVFAGATNTPLACTLMGIELFGAGNAIYYATGCFIAFLFSGTGGIYRAQRTPR